MRTVLSNPLDWDGYLAIPFLALMAPYLLWNPILRTVGMKERILKPINSYVECYKEAEAAEAAELEAAKNRNTGGNIADEESRIEGPRTK